MKKCVFLLLISLVVAAAAGQFLEQPAYGTLQNNSLTVKPDVEKADVVQVKNTSADDYTYYEARGAIWQDPAVSVTITETIAPGATYTLKYGGYVSGNNYYLKLKEQSCTNRYLSITGNKEKPVIRSTIFSYQ